MLKARRMGHATFETNDLERDLDYYLNTIGLSFASREGNRAYLSTECGQLSVTLEQGAANACVALSFEVAPDTDLGDAKRAFERDGMAPALQGDPVPGIAQMLTITDPKGTRLELFSRWAPVRGNSPVGGLRPNKLGHIAFKAPDLKGLEAYYASALGFRVADWIEDWFVFMRCSPDHHTVNFIRGPANRVHHIAFELRDSSHLIRACDQLARDKFEILWGPTRQGPGHNVAVYHRNPAGHLIELFTDLDVMPDDALGYFEPRPWHRDRPQRPKVWHGPTRQTWGLPPSPEFLRDTP
ncbi:MAG: VOC family protein [Rhizobiales bacterium]|nr:VOC family protein [Hyphomicrobiales bacterium]